MNLWSFPRHGPCTLVMHKYRVPARCWNSEVESLTGWEVPCKQLMWICHHPKCSSKSGLLLSQQESVLAQRTWFTIWRHKPILAVTCFESQIASQQIQRETHNMFCRTMDSFGAVFFFKSWPCVLEQHKDRTQPAALWQCQGMRKQILELNKFEVTRRFSVWKLQNHLGLSNCTWNSN